MKRVITVAAIVASAFSVGALAALPVFQASTAAASPTLVTATVTTPNGQPLYLQSMDVYAGPNCDALTLVEHATSSPNCGQPGSDAQECVWVESGQSALTSDMIKQEFGPGVGCFSMVSTPAPMEGAAKIAVTWDESTGQYTSATPTQIKQTYVNS